MRTFLLTIVVVTAILFGAPAFAGQAQVHHIVLFDLKDNVTEKQIEEMITVGVALLADIPGVLEVSINKKARQDRKVHIKDYDVALYVRWKDNKTGDVYGPHVLHQSFLKLYKPLVAGIKVIDFYGN